MKRVHVLLCCVLAACYRPPSAGGISPADATCERLSEAVDEDRPLSGEVTRGAFRLGQALGRCPAAAADAIASGLWVERHQPQSGRFRFWYTMARYPVDSAIFAQGVRIFMDADAPLEARAAGLQLTLGMTERARWPTRRTNAWYSLPDLTSCAYPDGGTVTHAAHGSVQVIRPLASDQIEGRADAWRTVRAAPGTPARLRRWLGTC